MERIKALEVGRTKLGEINSVTPEGKYVTLNVYYGNYLYPMVGNEYRHQTQDAYMKLLDAFLHSEAGQQYIIPTQEEINAACLAVANKEKEFMERRNKELSKLEEQNRKQPTPEYIDENVVPPNLRGTYTKPKPKPEPEEPQRRFEDDEPEEAEKKGIAGMFGKQRAQKPKTAPITKTEAERIVEKYKRRDAILIAIIAFLSVVIGFELVLNLFLIIN